MKVKFKHIIFSITIIFFSLWLFRFIYNKIELKKEKSITYILTKTEKNLINNGDIILRRGHGLVSDYIANAFNEKYSITHSGIILKQNNKIEVVHSESSSVLATEGIQTQDFDSFTDAGHENSVIIVRFRKCKPNDYIKITDRAQYYLSKKVPFSYILRPEDTTEMFCSELIWHIFIDEFNIDIFSNKNKETDFYQFKNFLDTTNFDIILNHQENNQFNK